MELFNNFSFTLILPQENERQPITKTSPSEIFSFHNYRKSWVRGSQIFKEWIRL